MALAGTSRMTAALSSAGCSHMFSWVCYQSRVTPFTHIPWWSPEEGVGLGHRGEEGAIFELQEEEGAGLEMKWDLILDSALWTDHCWSWAMSIHCTIVYFCMCLQSPVTEGVFKRLHSGRMTEVFLRSFGDYNVLFLFSSGGTDQHVVVPAWGLDRGWEAAGSRTSWDLCFLVFDSQFCPQLPCFKRKFFLPRPACRSLCGIWQKSCLLCVTYYMVRHLYMLIAWAHDKIVTS